VDDERSMREMLAILLTREGHDVIAAESGRRAIDLIASRSFDVVVSDARMPDVDGLEVLRQARSVNPNVIAIMVTAYGSPDLLRGVETLGVNDYVEKPVNTEVLKFRIRKELIARAIHVRSTRADRPFVAVNCGALTETLLESELFGHVRGAFTGADGNKKGLIEVADKGTIFLDEIGDMSPMLQVKLLRVPQERRFRRVGGTEEIDADIRIIAATNRDLARMVSDGQFREDLFYRINVIPVRMPPLRERTGDIPQLAEHFVAKFAPQMKKDLTGIAPAAMANLTAYAWPGNVRELENAMERAVALERTPVITHESLPDSLRGTRAAAPPAAAAASSPLPDAGFDLEQHVQHIEREYIAEALRRSGGVKVKAAELLGMSFRSFRYYMKKYNLG
jgi:two-component system response regulator PilR (NtrC family)